MTGFVIGLMVGTVVFGTLWWVERRRVGELEEQIVRFEKALRALEGTARRVR